MVVHITPIVTLAISNCFERPKAFWICVLLGLIFDFMVLSVPLGFYSFICGITSLLWCSFKPHLPPIKNLLCTPMIFFFFFIFSFLECASVGFFFHTIQDLLLGPLLDCATFLMLVLISSIGIRLSFEDSKLYFWLQKILFFSPKNGFFRKVKSTGTLRSASPFSLKSKNDGSSKFHPDERTTYETD
jgi:hypothetical protein